jgi:DNA-binding MarR family transcriptional regulator
VAFQLQRLGRAVKQLQYRHHRALDRRLRNVGTTLAQWDVLRAVAWFPDSSAHALAEATFQTDQSFGAMAGRLVELGLIQRVTGPGRAIRHRLTPAGEAQLEAGQEAVTGVLEASFAPLTGAQRRQLYELISAVLASPMDDELLLRERTARA